MAAAKNFNHDFAIIGKLNNRNDSRPMTASAKSSHRLEHFKVRVEHTKTGAWLANATGH